MGLPLRSVSRTRATSRRPGASASWTSAGGDVGQPELGPAEQPQRTVAWHLPPDQADAAVRAVAAYVRAGEVEAIAVAAHGHRSLPARRRSIPGYRLDSAPRPSRNSQGYPAGIAAAQRDVHVAVAPPAAGRGTGKPG
jgi:hypothetical protein